MDTIYALASATGKAGVSVLRVSGPKVLDVATSMLGSCPKQRNASFVRINDQNGELIDTGIAIFFKSPASFTGEDVLELHVHGSVSVIGALTDSLSNFDTVRLAEPGEFTRRALDNNKLDLSQVEGLADLINSETEAQRKQAQRVLSGELGRKVSEWRSDLIRAAALLEATIDFVDEEVPEDVYPEVNELLSNTCKVLQAEAEGAVFAERLRSGFEVVILGRPNVGKSSLLNKLAGREAAITSEIEGTTRDVVEVRMDLNGLPVTLLDTAGIRATNDVIEGLGIERALERAVKADLALILTDDGGLPDGVDEIGDKIFVFTKGDLTGNKDAVSVRTGAGIDELIDKISDFLKEKSAVVGVASRDRHRTSLKRSIDHIETVRFMLVDGCDQTELLAEGVRSAIGALDSLIGQVGVEDILDEIFSSFCLGK
ncbi:MAG: tRNA uridine-5-carboxymethylaminomethyl(34) synthesis GTPase MnmE [Paracoccaceae bacterium]